MTYQRQKEGKSIVAGAHALSFKEVIQLVKIKKAAGTSARPPELNLCADLEDYLKLY